MWQIATYGFGMAQSIRISDECYAAAQQVAKGMNRSLAQQLEHWVRLGMRIDLGLTARQTLALLDTQTKIADWAKPDSQDIVSASQSQDRTALRHAKLEADVAAGRRSAGSLIAIPAGVARRAKRTFPPAAFGTGKAW
jgi:hypothetical protein